MYTFVQRSRDRGFARTTSLACASLALAFSGCSTGTSLDVTTAPLSASCVADAEAVPEGGLACPGTHVVECDREASSTLYVVASDGAALEACGAPLSVDRESPLPVGTHQVNVNADADGETQLVCEVELTVVDTQPPVATARGMMLWPPNHKLRAIGIDDCVEIIDACDDDVEVTFTYASSDEPENGRGDGNHAPDIIFEDCDRLSLRSERQGGADGRIYTLGWRARDASGNETNGECQVGVPHDRGRGSTPIDSGAVYTIEAPEACTAGPDDGEGVPDGGVDDDGDDDDNGGDADAGGDDPVVVF